jgi:hypothetical protein
MLRFSTSRPKNLGAGLLSGSKKFAKGFLAGALVLATAPLTGARDGGLKGLVNGTAASDEGEDLENGGCGSDPSSRRQAG